MKMVFQLHPTDKDMVQIFSEDKETLIAVCHSDCFLSDPDLHEKITQDTDAPDQVDVIVAMY